MAVRRGLQAVAVILVAVAVVVAGLRLLSGGVDVKDVEVATVDVGDLQVSVTAGGSVVPERQEIIVSPINTRIV